jgi:hypothetical protein
MTTTTAAPFIAADTFTGRHTLRSNAARSDVFTAAELAAGGKVGEVLVLWESAGRMHDGVRLFCRTRFVPQADGSLHGYDSDGVRKIIHPADREIRVMTK